MTRDEWQQLAQAYTAWWPTSKMNDEVAAVWYTTLDDLEGGHVASALAALSQTSKFGPSLSELRAETARQEVIARPIALPAPRDDAGSMISFREWRLRGCHGLPASLTPADADRITGSAHWRAATDG